MCPEMWILSQIYDGSEGQTPIYFGMQRRSPTIWIMKIFLGLRARAPHCIWCVLGFRVSSLVLRHSWRSNEDCNSSSVCGSTCGTPAILNRVYYVSASYFHSLNVHSLCWIKCIVRGPLAKSVTGLRKDCRRRIWAYASQRLLETDPGLG